SVTLTGTQNKVLVAAIPTGPAGTTKRGIYRSTANGAQFFLVSYLNDNATVTLTDVASDRIGQAGGLVNKITPRSPVNKPMGTAPHADSRFMVFDSSGRLLEGDDGGIYRLVRPAGGGARYWEALIGDLQITEVADVGYDYLNHVAIEGTQVTGAQQEHGPASPQWKG